MSAITKTRTNIFTAIGRLFSSEIDVEDNEEIKLPSELTDALISLAKKEANVEQAINGVSNNSSKRGGFAKKINPIKDAKTEEAMRAKYQEVQQTLDKERE